MTRLQALICSIAVAPAGLHGSELLIQVTDSTAQPLEHAVVLLGSGADTALSQDTRAGQTARMTQQNRLFSPHVLVVPSGSGVEFPNLDNTQHHVYSFSAAKTFELELYSGQPEAPVEFDSPGVVELGCNIHDQMQAFVVVADTPFHGTSHPQGHIRRPLPEGTGYPLQLRVWHPRLEDNRVLQTLTVSAPVDGPVTVLLAVTPVAEPSTSLERLQQRFRDL